MPDQSWNMRELETFGRRHALRLAQFGILSHYVNASPLRLVLALRGEVDRFWQLVETLAFDDDMKSLTDMLVHILPAWNEGTHGVLCTAFNEEPEPA